MASWLFILCTFQTLLVGVVVTGVDYVFLEQYELMPALVLHIIILVYIAAFYTNKPWHIVIAALTGLVIQSAWLYQQLGVGTDINCMNGNSFDCRHRVEYYVSAGYVAAVYTCALMLESEKATRAELHSLVEI